MNKRYVLCWHLPQGIEGGARVVRSLEEAQRLLDELPGTSNFRMDFELYELGARVQLDKFVIEEPQPPRVKTQYRIKE